MTVSETAARQPSDGWKAFMKELHGRDPLPLIDPRDWQGKPVGAHGGRVAIAGDRACLEAALVALQTV